MKDDERNRLLRASTLTTLAALAMLAGVGVILSLLFRMIVLDHVVPFGGAVLQVLFGLLVYSIGMVVMFGEMSAKSKNSNYVQGTTGRF